ncbi:MAG: phosphoribosylanthranilate isomerase [Lunatimonas sp.]|uniref:phosphoribosylanthranilate isomerase n=1 Tax=Lunatimonas sp. TaxID=2060141 RepID=UPI00263AF9DD|nr:phosphoribosylanthranilate isomerase [Lunatimonas sp.]MCC5938869.1 phosphoribosylanthranilate isomerase [Lunatimonas sp.]
MIIKVCGMRDPENIRQLIEAPKPDLMGLIFYPKSSRYVAELAEDRGFYRSLDIPKVGVFVNAHIGELVDAVREYGLEYVQLHGDEDLTYIASLRVVLPVKIIKVFRIDTTWEWKYAEPFVNQVDWFLFDTQTPQYGGSGHAFSWDILRSYPFDQPFLLSGGITESHSEEIKALMGAIPAMHGVDINSRFELSPGVKDIAMVKTFMQKLRLTY